MNDIVLREVKMQGQRWRCSLGEILVYFQVGVTQQQQKRERIKIREYKGMVS